LILLLASAGTLGILATVSPSVRDELEVSMLPQPVQHLELSFEDPAGLLDSCASSSSSLPLEVSLHSHLDAPTRVRYVLTVDAAPGSTSGISTTTGTVLLLPGRRSVVRQRVGVPDAGDFEVRVDLPGRPERLTLRCREGRA
jgi:hypothetical protein